MTHVLEIWIMAWDKHQQSAEVSQLTWSQHSPFW